MFIAEILLILSASSLVLAQNITGNITLTNGTLNNLTPAVVTNGTVIWGGSGHNAWTFQSHNEDAALVLYAFNCPNYYGYYGHFPFMIVNGTAFPLFTISIVNFVKNIRVELQYHLNVTIISTIGLDATMMSGPSYGLVDDPVNYQIELRSENWYPVQNYYSGHIGYIRDFNHPNINSITATSSVTAASTPTNAPIPTPIISSGLSNHAVSMLLWMVSLMAVFIDI